ncbi:MAG: hypothetical protein HQK79_16005, partial [Desulfobacterales bacterium]|nr:hypothetical protein [Desulfobacterales bacterium]
NTSGEKINWKILTSKKILSDVNEEQLIEIKNGTKVNVPANAIVKDCTFIIGQVINKPSFPTNIKAIGKAIEFGPSGINFNKPVSITLPYTGKDLETAGIDDAGNLEVYTYNESSKAWEKVSKDHVDKEKSVIVCKVEHFSSYALGSEAKTSSNEETNSNSGNNNNSNSSNAQNSGVGTGGSSSGGGGGCFISSLDSIEQLNYIWFVISSGLFIIIGLIFKKNGEKNELERKYFC